MTAARNVMWLLAEQTLKMLVEARASGARIEPAEREAWEKRVAQSPPSFTGSVAEIAVHGVLTKEPDFFAALFGGGNTAYTDIIKQLAVANADPSISNVRLLVDSPGGHIDGLFDTIAAIEGVSKPITVHADRAESAAYVIAAVAGDITASTAGATFGSIGVAQTLAVDESLVHITNSESPDKRPDPKTAEGRAVIVKQLDALHDLLVESVAEHRDTTVKNVNKDFGRGASLLAGEAKRLGMIDGIAGPILRAVQPTNATAPRGAEGKATMTLEELRAQHPALYQAVFDLGVVQGIADENERVVGHLNIAATTGGDEVALKAIREGTAMTFGIQAEYFAAMAARSDKEARNLDDDETAAALRAAGNPASGHDSLGAQVATRVEELLGHEHPAEA